MIYTVSAAEFKKSFEGKYGPMNVWNLILGDGERAIDAEIVMKPESQPPAVGEELEGTIEKGEYGNRFKKAKQNGYGGGGGSPRVEDPKRAAMILRQHSQHMALLHIEGIERRFVPTEEKPRFQMESLEQLKQIIDFFDDDARKAGEKAG